MFYFHLHPSDGCLHLQVYHALRRSMLSGALPEGVKLPSKRSLAKDLGVSLNTVETAYAQLELEGYILRRERIGSFVRALDHQLVLPKQSPSPPSTPLHSPLEPLYDFSYHGVDEASFPFSIWRRLLKDSTEGDPKELLSSGDPKGYAPLRQAIAAYLLQSRGVETTMHDVLISAGTEHLFQLIRRLLGPSACYAFEDPGYAFGTPFFTCDLAEPIAIPVDESGLCCEALQRSAANVVLVTAAHQFPLGMILPIQRRLALLHWAAQSPERYIIEDDYDGEFKYLGKPVPALKSLDAADSVIYMGSFSKSITPALRISYLVLPRRLMARYDQQFQGFGCPCSIFTQKALARFIEQGYFETHLNRQRLSYGKKRALLEGLLTGHPGISVSGAEAGLSLLATLHTPSSEEALLEMALSVGVRAYGITSFRKESHGSSPQLLLGYAKLREEELRAAVPLLLSAIEASD